MTATSDIVAGTTVARSRLALLLLMAPALVWLIGQTDPSLGSEAPAVYAAACRSTKKEGVWLLEAWLHPLAVGRPLPTLPLWLADNLAVPLELEESYEETCRILRLP